MDVRIACQHSDQGTEHIRATVADNLVEISRHLSQDYGPGLEHLWIDLELSPVKMDRRSPYSFRFQRVVKPQGHLIGKKLLARLNIEPSHNVGHYSVQPDYFALAEIPLENISSYVLRLLYESTSILERRQKTFPLFRVLDFRREFLRLVTKTGTFRDPD